MARTVTSAVLKLITSYDPGAGNSPTYAPGPNVTLNDLRRYNFAHMDWLDIEEAFWTWELGGSGTLVAGVYTLDVMPRSALAGSGIYDPADIANVSKAAFDDRSLEALLQTLTVSSLLWTSESPNGTDGAGTAHLKIYGAYVDVTYDDDSTDRYWASGYTVDPGGKYAFLGTGGPGAAPTCIVQPEYAIDEDLTTYADIEVTNKRAGLFGLVSALWNPPKLILDWQLHVDCNNPPLGHVGTPYTHEFKARGGTGPYSFAITGGTFPPGLTLSTDGKAAGTPSKIGTYSFEITATEAGTTAALMATAQASEQGMTMATITPGASLQCAASSAAYMGVNTLDEPYWAIAVAVAPPDPAAAGVDSYVVTVQAGTDPEKDFFSVSIPSAETIMADTLLGGYGAASITFRVYSVSSGTRTLITTAWSGASTQVVTIGTAPASATAGNELSQQLNDALTALGGATSRVLAQASNAVYMGKNSLDQDYWSIAVVAQPGSAASGGYVITAQNTNASGTAGGTDSAEKDFSYISLPADASQIADDLTGLYQSDPASTYDAITFRLYSINEYTLARTLVTDAWQSGDHQTVVYGTVPEGATVPVVIPNAMVASAICSITIGEGSLNASCGEPGIVTIGEPFSFRPIVRFGTVTLDLTYDQDGTLNWDVSNLPPGLTWDNTAGSATFGTIAGTATQPGTYAYTATITTKDGQTTTITCDLQVEGAGFSEACGTPPVAPIWLPYSFAPPFVLDTDYASWTFTGLPPGLAFDAVSGKIAGTPTELGAYVYTAVLGETSFTCSITVVSQGDSGVENCGTAPSLVVGLPFSFIPPFASKAAVTDWTFSGLPPGLGWDTGPTSATYGHITGTPSAAGGYAYHADAPGFHFVCTLIVRLPGDPGDGANDTGGKGYCWWLDLWVWQPVFAFSILNQQVQMPPAYQRALRYTLARELAPIYGRDPSIVSALADEATAEVDRLNISNAAGTEDPPAPPPAQQG